MVKDYGLLQDMATIYPYTLSHVANGTVSKANRIHHDPP